MAEPRPHVVHENELPAHRSDDDAGTFRIPIDPTVGCRNLTQVIARFDPGASSPIERKAQEEIMYVTAGRGRARVEELEFDLEPGTAALVPPGADGSLWNDGPGPLSMVVGVSPPFGGTIPPSPTRPETAPASLHERDQEDLPAGEDRHFKLLIDPRHGARNVTQFVGFIDRSQAPFHTHTYEEAIYILEGEGLVHIESHADTPIRPGTSIFLPPGTPHCLENRSDGVLKLLGVFSPPGSPAAKKED